VAYSHQPRDPRAKLREVVTRWTESMRVAGRSPNREVVFGDDGLREQGQRVRGWLVDDRRFDAGSDRYLLMDDGDVWRAGQPDGPSPALDAAVDAWLAEPNDDLVMLLARSLGDARLGGSGWLQEGGGVERVSDRRQGRGPHGGPDRRGGD
jgi:hypothetical protein